MKLESTAIICAYNEQKAITNLLEDVYKTHFFNEIIVINDGSKDSTGELIKEFKKTNDIVDVHLLKNKGKGFAMAKGTELASSKYLVFIDADLSNFTTEHANKLLNPVLNGNADMVLGQPSKTLIRPEINPFKSLSGQRALKKIDILPILKKMESVRYGVETLINMHFKANNKEVEYVCLKNLVHPTKFQKTKPHKAILEFILVGCQIVATTFSNTKMTANSNKDRVLNILSINN
ncbi:MAG: glycosyltransferase family 2 protein [Bacteroidales bacterium]|nr:glycosyltransferase family 2 protein [Bacteroidales bacterium]